jgi:hypothetical protein
MLHTVSLVVALLLTSGYIVVTRAPLSAKLTVLALTAVYLAIFWWSPGWRLFATFLEVAVGVYIGTYLKNQSLG